MLDAPDPDSDAGFTNNWFGTSAKYIWDTIVPQMAPAAMLEIGSYEGASACYLIETFADKYPIAIHCIDTWEGGAEHRRSGVDMSAVERRFLANTKRVRERSVHPVELTAHKGPSLQCLAKLISDGFSERFDLVYIDGSHSAPDVLADAVLSFPLLKVGGTMIFDDYTWRHTLGASQDPLDVPKPAIDTFLNIYFHKMSIVHSPNSQVFAMKTSN